MVGWNTLTKGIGRLSEHPSVASGGHTEHPEQPRHTRSCAPRTRNHARPSDRPQQSHDLPGQAARADTEDRAPVGIGRAERLADRERPPGVGGRAARVARGAAVQRCLLQDGYALERLRCVHCRIPRRWLPWLEPIQNWLLVGSMPSRSRPRRRQFATSRNHRRAECAGGRLFAKAQEVGCDMAHLQ